MFSLSSSVVFALFGLSLADLGILIGFTAIVACVIIAISAFYFEHQRKKLWHETARIALEKGQPLPPRREEDEPRDSSRNLANDLRAGLVLMGVGGGLYFILGRGIAAVVGFIGLALVLYALIAPLRAKRNPPQDPPSRS